VSWKNKLWFVSGSEPVEENALVGTNTQSYITEIVENNVKPT